MMKNNSEQEIKLIILLTDFSKNAKNAIKYAIDAFGKNIVYKLVNSYQVKTTGGSFLDLNDILKKESEENLALEKKWILDEYPDLDINVQTHSIFGSPVDAINRLKKDAHHDLVIMGTKGASGINAFLYGSVASEVIKATIIPVLSIPPDYHFEQIKSIVYANDGLGEENKEQLEALNQIQQLFDAKLKIVMVNKEEYKIDFSKTGLAEDKAEIEFIESENIAEGILNYVKKEQGDLLALLPKHTGFLSGLFHKSISKQLVQNARIPILSLENIKR